MLTKHLVLHGFAGMSPELRKGESLPIEDAVNVGFLTQVADSSQPVQTISTPNKSSWDTRAVVLLTLHPSPSCSSAPVNFC